MISFIEGGSVMACELIGAKLLAPYFGTSLYVWAAVMGVTLGGLMTGYFLGGFYSAKKKNLTDFLFFVLALGGLLVGILPVFGKYVMGKCLGMSLQAGATFSLIMFLFPPLVCMGMISPMLVSLLTKTIDKSGNSAGTVYAISTLGGIISTFLLGFYIIPNFGLKIPALVFAFLLVIPALFYFLKNKKLTHGILLSIALFLFSGLFFYNNSQKGISNKFKVIYESDGVLGQLKVVDHSSEWYTNDPTKIGRGLLVNNTMQSFMDLSNPENSSIWAWSSLIPTIISVYPQNSKVLLLGLGGGTIAKQLDRLKFKYDIVEIDKRIEKIAKEYFYLRKNTPVTIDDARHFIKTCHKKYDIVIFDTFLSESAPEHLLTVEAFADVKKILNKDGMFLANFYGFINGKTGKAARSVYRTIESEGFIPKIIATPGAEANRNLLFLGLTKELDFSEVNYSEPGVQLITDINPFVIHKSNFDYFDSVILTDEKPQLGILYSDAAMSWKKSYNSYYTQGFIDEKIY